MENNFISNHFEDCHASCQDECDEYFMDMAIKEAQKGEGFAHPNPLVGAVIVKEGKILAKGYHRKYGDLHAERDALKNAAESNADVKGATIYVTLEPCCHTGKQPPCTQAIIQSGISRVVTGSKDPNPLVNGKGIEELKKAGIQVRENVLKDKCDALNEIFFYYLQTKKPYVILKYACTADGKTALDSGKQEWISSQKSRENVQRTRANVMAVMVGVNTVLADNPKLTVRINDGKKHFQPLRIVADSHLRIPLDAELVTSAKEIPVILCCVKELNEEEEKKKAILLDKGLQIIQTSQNEHGRINLEELMVILGQKGIDSILVESGGTLTANFLFPPCAQKIQCYLCPKIFGQSRYTPVSGLGAKDIGDTVKLSRPSVTFFEDDLLLEYKVLPAKTQASSGEL